VGCFRFPWFLLIFLKNSFRDLMSISVFFVVFWFRSPVMYSRQCLSLTVCHKGPCLKSLGPVGLGSFIWGSLFKLEGSIDGFGWSDLRTFCFVEDDRPWGVINTWNDYFRILNIRMTTEKIRPVPMQNPDYCGWSIFTYFSSK